MLTLTKVPNEIYYTACEYNGIDIKIEQLEFAKEIWDDNNRLQNNGFEKALYDYMTMNGNFDLDYGKFKDVNGYIIK